MVYPGILPSMRNTFDAIREMRQTVSPRWVGAAIGVCEPFGALPGPCGIPVPVIRMTTTMTTMTTNDDVFASPSSGPSFLSASASTVYGSNDADDADDAPFFSS